MKNVLDFTALLLKTYFAPNASSWNIDLSLKLIALNHLFSNLK